MQQSQKDILLQILTIINYKKDKEKFLKEFEAMNYLESLATVLEEIPANIRDEIKVLARKGEESKIRKHISSEIYFQEVEKVSDEALSKFVAVISPVLTLAQKEKIAAVFS